jgi:hypothetical protein
MATALTFIRVIYDPEGDGEEAGGSDGPWSIQLLQIIFTEYSSRSQITHEHPLILSGLYPWSIKHATWLHLLFLNLPETKSKVTDWGIKSTLA